MGRRRKDGDPLGLAGTRLVPRRGKFYYRHRATATAPERWEDFGTDLATAKARAALFNDPGSNYGTVPYWLDQFLLHCQARVKAGTLSQRTLDDYTAAAPPLKAYFQRTMMDGVKPAHVQDYLQINADLGRLRQSNLERACLSACFSWLLRDPKNCPPGLLVNPCMRASGVKRNPEKKRERYVTDDEYRDVFAQASKSCQLMMELTFRTLQRPESDIIGWTTAIVRSKGGHKILYFRQAKTKTLMEIALTGRLLELVESITGTDDKVQRLHQPMVATLKGHHYTYDGISEMLKKARAKANKIRAREGREQIPSFGFRDLKGKGATDMWLAGEPIERIQALIGHADARTTEIYVKARYRETIQPNLIVI